MIFKLFILVIVIFSLAAAGEFPSEENLKPYEGKIIKEITIIRNNVFANEDGNLPFYFLWANKIHIITRKSVIEGELLFKVGEPLDIEKVIESARNIRLRMFIGEVEITATPHNGEGVDITVTTYDNWTTKAAISLESGGGTYFYGFSLAEDNLLGYGRIAQVSASFSEDNDGYTLFFNDDRMGRTRWSGSIQYSDYTLNNSISLQASRPQYSLDVPYSIGAGYIRSDGTNRFYSGGTEVFRYNRLINSFEISSKYSVGKKRRINFFALYNYQDLDYSEYYEGHPLNDYLIPPDERSSYPSLGVGGEYIEYDLERYLDEAGTPEDLVLGASGQIIVGRSVPQFGADYIGTRTAISTGFLVRPVKRLFFNGSDLVQWWHRNSRSERIYHITELLVYYKTTRTSVLAMRGLANFAWRQDPGYQILLGGTNGLRGYSDRELEGTRLVLGNLEYRYYSPITILTVRLGGVMFFDIGEVWDEEDRIRFDDMKSNVGMGLRFGLTKSSTARVLRFDIARALTENQYFVSFGTGMIFNLQSIFGHE
jgi:outer membrane protein assembly factor BamA